MDTIQRNAWESLVAEAREMGKDLLQGLTGEDLRRVNQCVADIADLQLRKIFNPAGDKWDAEIAIVVNTLNAERAILEKRAGDYALAMVNQAIGKLFSIAIAAAVAL